MSGRKVGFSSILLEGGWQTNVELLLDDAGMILDIAPAKASVSTGIAVPAVPNVHSHAHQRFMAGLAEKAGPSADSFWTWREAMYGFALRLGPDDLEAVAAQLYVEMLKGGFSTVGEFQYLHHQPDGRPYDNPAELSLRCVAAAERAGLAITILPTLYRWGGFGGSEPQEAQRRFINDWDRFGAILDRLEEHRNPLCRVGASPHSLRAVDKPLLEAVQKHVRGPIHMHVAEQVKEVEDCVRWSGRRPIEWLADNVSLSERWCIIHATHMSDDETTRLARSGAVAGLCPTTEANLGDGIFPARRFIDMGGAISIGSDSQITVSATEDLRQLEYSQRLRDRARNVLSDGPGRSTGRSLFERALRGGATALAQPIGMLAQGRRADIVVLDPDHPSLIGRTEDDVLDAWVFSGGNSCVRDVYVAGDLVIDNRRHAREQEIETAFRAAVQRLRS
jgi:formimidoylglutamate deiminase